MKTIEPFAVSDSAWTDYTVQSVCSKIVVCEVGQAGTSDYFARAPITSSGTGQKRAAGKEYTAECPKGTFFRPGEKPFSLKLDSGGGSIQFDGVEQ